MQQKMLASEFKVIKQCYILVSEQATTSKCIKILSFFKQITPEGGAGLRVNLLPPGAQGTVKKKKKKKVRKDA